MSHHRRSLAVMATIAAFATVPATAAASSQESARSANDTVQVHVTKAQKAVKRLKRAVRAGKTGVARRQLKTARSQTAAAARVARRMTYAATTDSQEIAATQALTLAGTQYDQLVEAITALVDEITGQAQTLIAQAISPSIAGKQQLIDLLNSMVDKVPAEAKPVLASVIAALSVGDATEVVNLDDAVDGGTLPVNISAIVTQALDLATESIESGFDMVQSLLPLLPPAAQAPLGTILDMVTSTAHDITPEVLTTATGLIDSVLGSLPFAGTTATAGFGLGGMLDGLVGDGAATVPDGIGTTISTLLGGGSAQAATTATGTIAGAPVGAILNSVTDMITTVLGGRLGR